MGLFRKKEEKSEYTIKLTKEPAPSNIWTYEVLNDDGDVVAHYNRCYTRNDALNRAKTIASVQKDIGYNKEEIYSPKNSDKQYIINVWSEEDHYFPWRVKVTSVNGQLIIKSNTMKDKNECWNLATRSCDDHSKGKLNFTKKYKPHKSKDTYEIHIFQSSDVSALNYAWNYEILLNGKVIKSADRNRDGYKNKTSRDALQSAKNLIKRKETKEKIAADEEFTETFKV